jgi:hypothetical protein
MITPEMGFISTVSAFSIILGPLASATNSGSVISGVISMISPPPFEELAVGFTSGVFPVGLSHPVTYRENKSRSAGAIA